MRRKALGFTGAFGAPWARASPRGPGSQKPMTSPPASTADDLRKARREALRTGVFMAAPYRFAPREAAAVFTASRMRG